MRYHRKSAPSNSSSSVVAVLSLLVACIAGLASCSSDGCYDNGSAVPLAKFYNSSTGALATVDSLTVQGLGAPGDSDLIAGQSVNQLYLPLRSTVQQSQYVLSYKSSLALAPDTVTLAYQAVPTFVSRDCGAMFFFDISGVNYTTHRIDSVVVVYPHITNQDRTSIKIFMKD